MYFLCEQHTKQGGFLRGAIVSSPCTRSVAVGRIVHDDDAIAKRGSGWVGGASSEAVTARRWRGVGEALARRWRGGEVGTRHKF